MHSTMIFDINKYNYVVDKTEPIKFTGHIKQVNRDFIISEGPKAVIGEVCKIILNNEKVISAEVVGLNGGDTLLMCYDEMEGIEVGNQVIAMGEMLSVFVGDHLLGRVLDGLGKDYDGIGQVGSAREYSTFHLPTDALKRQRITEPLTTGIKAIDGLLTVGKGQRVGIFAGSGVGKSTLLGMIAKNSSADINVIALIGERGKELREFIEDELGEEGMKKSVIIFASSNKNALNRVRGAYVATAIAEYFRDQGKDVMLMMDNLTRFAMAQREIGLPSGEPPTSRGYPPSVFSQLAKLVERAGTGTKGSITGFYAVLVEGDEMDEPISDAVRGLLDGHIYLSRDLANINHYPAIDVLSSISRVMTKIVNDNHKEKAADLRELIAEYKKGEDLINVGAYVEGANPKLDIAKLLKPQIDSFLRQGMFEHYDFEETIANLNDILSPLSQDTMVEDDGMSIFGDLDMQY